MKGSLRTRIIAWSFIPTAIILTTVAGVSVYAYQQLTANLVIERDRELTRLAAQLLADEMAAYTDPLSSQYLAIFDDVVAFNSTGTILAPEAEEYGLRGGDWLRRILSQQSKPSGRPSFSNVVVESLNGQKMIVVVMPTVGSNGQVAGGLAGLFRLDPTMDNPLIQRLDKLRRGPGHDVYLVDGRGRVILHSQRDRMGADFSAQPAVQEVLSRQVGAIRTHDLEGVEIVASFSPIPGTSWGLVSEESWAALSSVGRRYNRFSFLLLFLGIVTPTLIVGVGVRRITHPIEQLIDAAKGVAQGNFGQRISAPAGGEMEELARQFNSMAAQLQESYAHLEQKVADRTRELATLNAIAVEVSQSLELLEILDSALAQVLNVMALDKGLAFCMEEETQTLVLLAQRGFAANAISCRARHPLEAGAACEAAWQGRPLVERVSDRGDGAPSRWRDLLEQEEVQILVSTPIMAKGKIVGVLELGAKTLRTFSPEELALLWAIGLQIGVAVENARLYEQAQQLAVIRERSRLARDLHDSVTQALYGVNLCAEAAARQLALGQPTRAADHLREIRTTTQEAQREMRLMVFELRPPKLKRDGLAAALQARLEAVEEKVGLTTDLNVEGCRMLPSEVESGLYRVAQEALNNVLKHARASQVHVRLQQNDGRVWLEIEDDGVGFDPAAARSAGGMGLRGMEERVVRLGGTLTLSSHPGQGCRIRVEVAP